MIHSKETRFTTKRLPIAGPQPYFAEAGVRQVLSGGKLDSTRRQLCPDMMKGVTAGRRRKRKGLPGASDIRYLKKVTLNGEK